MTCLWCGVKLRRAPNENRKCPGQLSSVLNIVMHFSRHRVLLPLSAETLGWQHVDFGTAQDGPNDDRARTRTSELHRTRNTVSETRRLLYDVISGTRRELDSRIGAFAQRPPPRWFN